MDSLTDEQLVLQIQNGNREALEQLYWRYKDRIIGVAYGVLRNQQDALEVTQEVFVRLYNNIDKYQPNSHFFTWVYRIAHNLAIDRYRRKRTASEVEFDHEFQLNYTTSDIPLAPGLGIDPERSAERSELRAQIAAAMDSLSEKQRTIITLREIDGLSYEEIAAVLDIQIGTVMSRLHYARANLQAALKTYIDCLDVKK